jgi:hypothetical protein
VHLFSAPFCVKIDLVALGPNYQALDQLFQTRQSTRQVYLKEEGLNFQEQSSLAKHSGAANEVWFHGYHDNWTRREGTRGPTMSQPTRPKDPSQEARYRGSPKDNQ